MSATVSRSSMTSSSMRSASWFSAVPTSATSFGPSVEARAARSPALIRRAGLRAVLERTDEPPGDQFTPDEAERDEPDAGHRQ
jgi:hypothetical protein